MRRLAPGSRTLLLVLPGLVAVVLAAAAAYPLADSWTPFAQWKVDVPPPDPVWGKLMRPLIALAPEADRVAFAPAGSREVTVREAKSGRLVRAFPQFEIPKDAETGNLRGVLVKVDFSADRTWLIGQQAFSTLDYSSNQYDRLSCVLLWKLDASSSRVLSLNDSQSAPYYDMVQDIAFSPKGSKFAVALASKILIGDANDPASLRTLELGALVRAASPEQAYMPVRIVFSPDGNQLAVGFNRSPRDLEEGRYVHRPARVALWDLSQEAIAPRLMSSPFVGTHLFERIDALAFSADGQKILVAGPGAWIWDLKASKNAPLPIPAPFEATLGAGFDRTGAHVVLAGLGTQPFRFPKKSVAKYPDPMPEPPEKADWESRIVTVDLSTGQSTVSLRPGIRAAAWSQSASLLATTKRDGTVSLEQLEAGTEGK